MTETMLVKNRQQNMKKKLKAYIESIYENIKIYKYKKVHIAI